MIPWLATPAGGFVLKGVAILAVALALKYAIGNYQDNLIERALAEAEAKATADHLARTHALLRDERARVAVLQEELTAARTAAAARTAVLNQHNLGDLLQAKPLMIERRINTATIEVWREIEDESREGR